MVSRSSLLFRRTARHALELAGVLSRHARFVPGAFAAFPEAVAFLADKPGMAEAAVFGAVVLLAGTCEGGVWLVGSFVRWVCLLFGGECSREMGGSRVCVGACVVGLLLGLSLQKPL